MAGHHLYQVLKTNIGWFIGSDQVPENPVSFCPIELMRIERCFAASVISFARK